MKRQLIYVSRIFDGLDAVIDDGAVIIEQSKIVEIGNKNDLLKKYSSSEIEVHAHDDCTLLPGLIDSHTHLIMPGTGVNLTEYVKNPDEVLFYVAAQNTNIALKAGVTTIVDLGSKHDLTFVLRNAINNGYVQGSRLLLCGKALTITGGHGSQWGGEVDGVENLRAEVRNLCKKGSDIIKVMTTGRGQPFDRGIYPAYSDEELRAIIETAHMRGRRVIGHVTSTEMINNSVNAGIDLIAHCQFFNQDAKFQFDKPAAQRILDSGVVVNPTLQINRILTTDYVKNQLSETERYRLDAWSKNYPYFEEAFNEMYQMGIPMIAGSDCGWGWSKFDEFYLELDAMVTAGMRPMDAIKSATGRAAEILQVSDRIGSLAPGKLADLLVVKGNPLENIMDLENVKSVWYEGKEIEI